MALGKILIVEDDPTAHFIVGLLNRQLQFAEEVVFAIDGAKALEVMKDGAFNLILLDINMPVMDGFEFLDSLMPLRLMEGVTIPPIIVMSSSHNPRDKARAAGYPLVKGYLVKPFSKEHVNYLLGLSLEGAELETT